MMGRGMHTTYPGMHAIGACYVRRTYKISWITLDQFAKCNPTDFAGPRVLRLLALLTAPQISNLT